MQDYHLLFHSIHQLSRLLIQYKNEALRPFGLYSAQWAIIYTLKVKGPQTQSDIATYLSVEAPHVTRTIKKLVELGICITMAGEDKRTKHVQLTEHALLEFPKWEQAVLTVNEKLLTKIPVASQKELSLILKNWLHELTWEETQLGNT